jgi:WD40 repeat protein
MMALVVPLSMLAATLAATTTTAPPPAPERPSPRQVISVRLEGRVVSLAFSADGRLLASVSDEGALRVWDVARRAPLRTVRRPGLVHALLARVAWGLRPGLLVLQQPSALAYDVEADRPVAAFVGERGDGTGERVVAFPGSAERSFVGQDGCDVRFFTAEGRPREALPWPAGLSCVGTVVRLFPSPDGSWLVAATSSHGIVRWRLGASVDPQRFPVDGLVKGAAIAPDHDAVIVSVELPERGGARLVRIPLGTAPPVVLASDPSSSVATEAVALSPDGTVVAIGGPNVSVRDARTGEVRWSLDALTTVLRGARALGHGIATAVAFSPDGGTLAVGNGRGDILLLDARTGVTTAELGVGVRRAFQLLFPKDGRELVTTSLDGVSRWDLVSGRRSGAREIYAPTQTVETSAGGLLVARGYPSSLQPDASPLCPALLGGSPYANRVVLDPWDRTAGSAGRVEPGRGLVLAAPDTARSRDPSAAAVPFCFPGAFQVADVDAPRARALLRFTEPERMAIARFGGGEPVELEGSARFFWARLAGGAPRAVGTNLKVALVWDSASGRILHRLTIPETPEVSGVASFGVSPDGSRVALLSRDLGSPTNVVAVHDLESGRRLWALFVPTLVTAHAFLPDGSLLVGAGDGELGVARDGKVTATARADGAGAILTLAVSPDGRLAASAGQDGSVRLWSLPDLTLRATLVDFQDDEWASFAPSGAFEGTPEGTSRIGWTFDAPLEFFALAQFEATHRRPELVRTALAGRPTALAPPRRPPSVEARPEVSGATARVAARARSGGRVESLVAFREGRPVASASARSAIAEAVLDVPLRPGPNRVTVAAFDELGHGANPVLLDLAGPPSGRRPDLWVVAVGVDRYPHLPKEFQLAAAEADARAISGVFAEQVGAGRPFAELHATTLLGGAASAASIERALAGLAAMKEDDLAVVFLAGHGVQPRGSARMLFLTGEARLSAERGAPGTLGWSSVARHLSAARGRVLLLLDACHAGHLAPDELLPPGAIASGLLHDGRGGTVVFAASKGRQLSAERGGHGLFTRAILDALTGPATDRDRDGLVSLSELVEAVTVAVDRESEGRQTPWVARRETFGDYVLAAARR